MLSRSLKPSDIITRKCLEHQLFTDTFYKFARRSVIFVVHGESISFNISKRERILTTIITIIINSNEWQYTPTRTVLSGEVSCWGVPLQRMQQTEIVL